jgi:hypothetical protein
MHLAGSECNPNAAFIIAAAFVIVAIVIVIVIVPLLVEIPVVIVADIAGTWILDVIVGVPAITIGVADHSGGSGARSYSQRPYTHQKSDGSHRSHFFQ